MVLNVLIIGAGIGGLSAAIALRRNGHNVQVFEQSRLASETGAAIYMMPNATSVLRSLGVDVQDGDACLLEKLRTRKSDGELIHEEDLSASKDRWEGEARMAHRKQLHTQLKMKAISSEGPGAAAVLHTAARVVGVNALEGTVTLNDGRVISGDVVIGADGAHSIARGVIDENIRLEPPAHNAFRFMIPRKAALDDVVTAKIAMDLGTTEMWYAEDRKIIMYTCDNNTTLNFVGIHPSSLSTAGSGYKTVGSKDVMLDIYKDFEKGVYSLLSKADESTLKVYPLQDMAQLPTFVKDRLALIGDAAHPFLPHLGQGGAQAIEDAACLGVMLDSATTVEEVPVRLQLFNQRRYERSSTIQEYTRITGKDGVSSGKAADQAHSAMGVAHYFEYAFSHNEFHASTQHLRQHLWNQNPNLHWRVPTVFGPMPGPRQDFLGNSRQKQSLEGARRETASITFRTSATLLRNLLPDNLEFIHSDTVATVTLSVESLTNLEWLGGQGYAALSMSINGVQYLKPGRETICGTFIPVVFENLADPIVSGREELGWPKIYSEITISRSPGTLTAVLSWRGAQWGTFSFPDLKEADTPVKSDSQDKRIFIHKFLPTTGPQSGSEPDASYTAVSDLAELAVTGTVERVQECERPSFSFNALDWKRLPTLHHIVARLAELPVLSIESGTVSDFKGMEDQRRFTRLCD